MGALAFGIAFVVSAQDPKLAEKRSFRDRIALIAADNTSGFGSGAIEDLEEQVKRKLSSAERSVFEITEEGRWKTFEDELIRFEHPDHALFTVSVLDEQSKEPIRVVGGVASMADNSFQRAYHLKVGELYYGAIFVREADWFDEGICMCGPIVFKKFTLEDGTALEFSLLPSGDVKKVQALGAKHRAIFFEWTHSVIPQGAYARLGRSLRFKQASLRTMEEWRGLSKERRGVAGLVSWLEPGDDAAKVGAVLGEPTRTTGELSEYVAEYWQPDGGGHRTTLSVDLKGGVFTRLGVGWHKWEELPPRQGSIAWAEKRLEHWKSENVPERDKATLMGKELAQMVDLFLEKGAGAGEPEWSRWGGVAFAATELGLKDQRVLAAVRKRFQEKDLSHFYSNAILEAFNVPDRQSLFEGRAAHLLGRENPARGAELNNLFAMIDPKGPAFEQLIKRACAHEDPRTRDTAYGFADRLPQAIGLELLRSGVSDPNPSARRMAALCIDEVVTRADIPWLRDRIQKEPAPEVREALEEAVEAAGQKK